MLARLLSLLAYAATAAFILIFVFGNRQMVDLALPLSDYTITLPLYLALAMVFAAGLLLGLLHSLTIAMKSKRCAYRDRRVIRQLEDALSHRNPQLPPS